MKTATRAQIANKRHRLTGNGAQPTSRPIQLGCCKTAPLRPHASHRAEARSRSLDAFGPHRMIRGVSANGLR
jgi:hypothetical protein